MLGTISFLGIKNTIYLLDKGMCYFFYKSIGIFCNPSFGSVVFFFVVLKRYPFKTNVCKFVLKLRR